MSNVNLCFCSHEILSTFFPFSAQNTERLEKLETEYRNFLLQGKKWFEEKSEAFMLIYMYLFFS